MKTAGYSPPMIPSNSYSFLYNNNKTVDQPFFLHQKWLM